MLALTETLFRPYFFSLTRTLREIDYCDLIRALHLLGHKNVKNSVLRFLCFCLVNVKPHKKGLILGHFKAVKKLYVQKHACFC